MNAQRDRIREKLRRLLSMTVDNGASEAEALAAAAAAARLMAEHNMAYRSVEEIDAEGFSNDTRDWFKGAKGRHRSAPLPAAVRCLSAICDLCGVEHMFDTWTGRLTFFGAPSDTDVAHYLVVIISRAMDREWEAQRRTLPAAAARKQRASFYLAMSIRIAQRLFAMAEEQRPAASATGTSLFIVKNAMVRERFESANGKPKPVRANTKAASFEGVRAGLDAGARIPLNKGINEAKGALAITKEPA
jgi:hypothetical protein